MRVIRDMAEIVDAIRDDDAIVIYVAGAPLLRLPIRKAAWLAARLTAAIAEAA